MEKKTGLCALLEMKELKRFGVEELRALNRKMELKLIVSISKRKRREFLLT